MLSDVGEALGQQAVYASRAHLRAGTHGLQRARSRQHADSVDGVKHTVARQEFIVGEAMQDKAMQTTDMDICSEIGSLIPVAECPRARWT